MYVFDLDGTLIDSTKRHYLLMARLLKEAEQRITHDFVQGYMSYKAAGNSGYQYLERILHIPSDLACTIQQKWIDEIESKYWLNYDKLYADAIPILDFLKEHNKRIIFLTMRKNEAFLHEELRMLGINIYPDEVIVLTPCGQIHKGDVLKKSNEVIDFVIGDTETDYDAAVQVRAKSYILHRGFRNRDFWKRRKVISYDSLAYLKQIIIDG